MISRGTPPVGSDAQDATSSVAIKLNLKENQFLCSLRTGAHRWGQVLQNSIPTTASHFPFTARLTVA